jgi:hypothetical protein
MSFLGLKIELYTLDYTYCLDYKLRDHAIVSDIDIDNDIHVN